MSHIFSPLELQLIHSLKATVDLRYTDKVLSQVLEYRLSGISVNADDYLVSPADRKKAGLSYASAEIV